MEEGLYFEVKPRGDGAPRPGSSDRPSPNRTFDQKSCPSPVHLYSPSRCLNKVPSARKGLATWREKLEEEFEEVQYKLTLVGSLPVHHLTTMAMLPWVVAEISRSQPSEKDLGAMLECGGLSEGQLEPSAENQTVFLCVSASSVRCVSILGEGVVWDPLSHTELFKCRPHQVTKLIHNSQEPSSFGCLVKDSSRCACYVFRCQDSNKPFQVCDGDVSLTTCRAGSLIHWAWSSDNCYITLNRFQAWEVTVQS